MKHKLIDGYWTSPRIHCKKCGAWVIADTQEDAVKEWNRCSLIVFNKATQIN